MSNSNESEYDYYDETDDEKKEGATPEKQIDENEAKEEGIKNTIINVLTNPDNNEPKAASDIKPDDKEKKDEDNQEEKIQNENENSPKIDNKPEEAEKEEELSAKQDDGEIKDPNSSDLPLIDISAITSKLNSPEKTQLDEAVSTNDRENYGKANELRKYNVEEGKMPPALKNVIYHAETSPTYRILNGETVPNLTQSIRNAVVSDLKKYIDISVDRGLISEACYIQTVIDSIKIEKTDAQIMNERELASTEQKIKETNQEIEERNKFWDSQKELIDKELEMSLRDLEMQREIAIQKLDEEWQSEKKMQHYSKPSPALLNLRDMAKKMIKAKKFDEVQKISKMIESKEQVEAAEATKRMNADYRIADKNTQDKFDHEITVLRSNHETKINNLTRSKERNLRPIRQRLENLTKQRETIIKNQKKATNPDNHQRIKVKSRAVATREIPKSTRRQNSSALPSILKNPKLSIAAVTPIKRENKSTSSASIFRPRSAVRTPVNEQKSHLE